MLKLLLATFALVAVSAPASSKFNWNSTKFVYAFGDSYTFVQGTLGYPNFSFVGDVLDLGFTPQQILSDEIIPRNTSSEGSNWIEYLTECFEGSPTLCQKQLWNFAFAGSDIDAALLPRHHDFTTSLVEQVGQWVEYASNVLPHPSDETLTFWWIGINDTGDTLNNATITDFAAFWETEMLSYFDAVQSAFDNGLKQHVFINVPPEDRNPATVGNATASAEMKEHIALFNVALSNHTAAFTARNADATVMTFDAHAVFSKILDDPVKFGFTNITGFCTCADPEGFFWYNSGHPTQAVHKLIAKALKSQLEAAST
ncbi:hypothetical protein F5878DRAFT_229673 [Lentinula raphanica]|uniref:Carbohydrate esterase family 16 protein n=1 Tax=Lentinula raphanica TaxID=153919 RepID=A0AA38P6T7_9AGAR|nr:hypothetical protein F5880DRAFT_1478978 [Lentinula raphanica]KAJ3837141.1 hypothetical protein F5878DRAFT_229673 [Lentinula raphanica]